MDKGERLLTDKQVAVILGVSPGTLRNWRVKRRGPKFIRFGRAIRYRMADLERHIALNTYEHTGEY